MCVYARVREIKKTIKERIYIHSSLRVAINHARVWCTVMEPLTSLNTWKWRQLPPNRRDFLIFCAISCAAHQLQPQKLLYSSSLERLHAGRGCRASLHGQSLMKTCLLPYSTLLTIYAPWKKISMLLEIIQSEDIPPEIVNYKVFVIGGNTFDNKANCVGVCICWCWSLLR